MKIQSNAKHCMACDECGAEMFDLNNPQPKHEHIAVALLGEPEENGARHKKEHNFCNEACMGSFISKRAEKNKENFESHAKVITQCDNCRKPIDDEDRKDAIAATLREPDGTNKQRHFHDEGCLAEFLNKKIVNAKKKTSKASVELNKYTFDVDLFADESVAKSITYKQRHDSSTTYLDPKHGSFPVRAGQAGCEDLHNVLHRIGTYEGEMSSEEIRTKVHHMMKERGCAMPKEWADKK